MAILIHVDPAISSLVPLYLKKKQADLVLLRNSLNNSDFKTIESIGHQMKGSAASYGFIALSDTGRQLETAALNQDKKVISDSLEFMGQYLNDVKLVESNSDRS